MKKNTFIINNNGFSLLEITIVLIIISILISTVIPVLSRAFLEKAANKTALDIFAIQEASRKFYIDNNKWPDTSVYSTPIAALQAGGYLPPATSWNAINPFGSSSATPVNYNYFILQPPISPTLLTVCSLVPTDAQNIILSSLTSPNVDANGNVCSSVPVPGGTSGFGPATAVSMNTVYQALTDGQVISHNGALGSDMDVWVGTTNNPTLNLCDGGVAVSGGDVNCFVTVAKGEYWKATGSGTVYWRPL